ncbi:Hsp20/alpha crystallin family protein [Patescibacteria group bacterium]|nr:Hsp20/alpha crystallin family protein [Patescibacteria group bacterium]
MPKDRRLFFERLTGSYPADNDEPTLRGEEQVTADAAVAQGTPGRKSPLPPVEGEGQLMADVYQTPDEIVMQSIVAGLKPEELDVSITRDMVTIKGRREKHREVSDDRYFHQELYWGSFSRAIMLPQEIDVETAEASIKNGLLTIRLPKLDKKRVQKLKIKHE